MTPSNSSKTRKYIELAVMLVIVISFMAGIVLNGGITGMLIGGEKTKTIDISQQYTEPSVLTIKAEGNITSLKLSGVFIGEGRGRILLEDKVIVDSGKLGSSRNLITGYQIYEETKIPEENITLYENINESAEGGNLILEENATINESIIIDENITVIENLSENILVDISETNKTTTENITQNISIEEELPEPIIKSFRNYCDETCTIYVPKDATLKIELDNMVLNLTSITYTYEEFVEEALNETNIIEVIENITANLTEINITNISLFENASEIIEESYSDVVIDEPVLWTRVINTTLSNSTILPGEAFNISSEHELKIKAKEKIYKISEFNNIARYKRITKQVKELEKPAKKEKTGGVFKRILELNKEISSLGTQETFNETNISIIIENSTGEISKISYYLEGPVAEEVVNNEFSKTIRISSDIHYQNIKAYSEIDEKPQNSIKVYWIVNETKQEVKGITFIDSNNNGLIDRIEWIVPHLSSQTYEIIYITKAQHLTSSREVISDIYEQVKLLDNIWSETINENEYVRVTFEIPLDSTRDITLYPRVVNETPVIEVYEKDKNELIAEFTNLNSNEYNKVLLTNLKGTQDTFDLKVVNGSVEFDYIVDPVSWWNSSWGYRKEINITNSGSTSLTNFPVYLNITYNETMQADYDDLRFINGSCASSGGVVLDYEIETSTAIKADIWIRIPVFSTGVNSICMYYNNSAASKGENKTGVWDNRHKMVLHFSEPGTGTRYDSSPNANNGTPVNYIGTEKNAAGKVDGADNISSGKYINTSYLQNAVVNYTIALWIRTSNSQGVLVQDRGSGTGMSITLAVDPSCGARGAHCSGSSAGVLGIGVDSNAVWRGRYSSSRIDDGNWHYVVGVFNSTSGQTVDSTFFNIYVDGQLNNGAAVNQAGTPTSPLTGLQGTKIGTHDAWTNMYFNGTIDELTISDVRRSPDWINQTYRLIANHYSYVNYGTAEQADTTYPLFFNYYDNNATLIVSGTGFFNVTINNTNGTVLLEVNNTNITATYLSGNVYNASYYFTTNGTYSYKWHSWGNGTSNNYNVSETRSYIVNQNYPPVITYVLDNQNENPIESSTKNIWLTYNVSDANGISHLNDSTAVIRLNKGGEILRNSSTCIAQVNDTTTNTKMYNCSISLQYYDMSGTWIINASIRDKLDIYVDNTAEVFTYGTLTSMRLGKASMNFTSVSIGQVNVASDQNPMIIDNTGNQNITEVNVTAFDLIKGSEILNATYFTMNASDGNGAGYQLQNNTPVRINNSFIPRDIGGVDQNGSLYQYVSLPNIPLLPGVFNASSFWLIDVS